MGGGGLRGKLFLTMKNKFLEDTIDKLIDNFIINWETNEMLRLFGIMWIYERKV